MNQAYPFKIGPFARRTILASVPHAPEGRSFGTVSSGIRLPEGGSFYIVEFDPENSNRVRILGYVDKYGRAFGCDAPLQAPPAEVPCVLVQTYPDTNGASGAVSIRSIATGNLVPVMGFTKVGESTSAVRMSFSDAMGPAADSGIDFSGLPKNMPYADFMSVCFLSLYRFLPDSDSGSCPMPSDDVFDLSGILERLGSGDLFSGIEREVLEAEASWASNCASGRGLERYLVRMLHEEDAVGKTASDFSAAMEGIEAPVVPSIHLIRTASYANTFYIDFSYSTPLAIYDDGLFRMNSATLNQRAALIGIEGALNRFLLLSEYLEKNGSGKLDESESLCAEFDHWLIDRICIQAPDPRDSLGLDGRWEKHLAFARLCERMRLPYRIAYDFRMNAAADAVAVNVAMPPSASLPKARWSREESAFVSFSDSDRNAMYARYAAHITLLLASIAFHVSPGIGRVLVTCCSAESGFDAVMSTEIERSSFEEAFAADEGHAFVDPFSVLSGFESHYRFGERFRLEKTSRIFSFDSGEFRLGREPLVCDDPAPFNDTARRALNASASSDLNIFEENGRRSLAEEVVSSMDKGSDAAMETIKCIHDRSENITVRRVCQGLMDDFASGALDAQSELEVREAFLDAYGFKAPMTRAAALYREDDAANATKVLEGLESLTDSCGAFSDTSLICYRYFDSYATRVIYEKLCQDDRANRKVLPLANESYLVHDLSAQVLTNSISGRAEGFRHAKRCVELSPAYATAYLRVARAYFVEGDFESEIAMCMEGLKRAWDPEDAGLAYYWMAFAYWKLDRFELALACYRKCISLGCRMSDQAAQECNELIGSVKGLQMHASEKEREMLAEAGVPVDALADNVEFLMRMAEAAVDSGADALGSVLVTSAMRVVRDDALLPVLGAIHP